VADLEASYIFYIFLYFLFVLKASCCGRKLVKPTPKSFVPIPFPSSIPPVPLSAFSGRTELMFRGEASSKACIRDVYI